MVAKISNLKTPPSNTIITPIMYLHVSIDPFLYSTSQTDNTRSNAKAAETIKATVNSWLDKRRRDIMSFYTRNTQCLKIENCMGKLWATQMRLTRLTQSTPHLGGSKIGAQGLRPYAPIFDLRSLVLSVPSALMTHVFPIVQRILRCMEGHVLKPHWQLNVDNLRKYISNRKFYTVQVECIWVDGYLK